MVQNPGQLTQVVGATIDLFPPSGEFTLAASDKPLVLISGGVGITPTLPMLEAALATQRSRTVWPAHTGDLKAKLVFKQTNWRSKSSPRREKWLAARAISKDTRCCPLATGAPPRSFIACRTS